MPLASIANAWDWAIVACRVMHSLAVVEDIEVDTYTLEFSRSKV